MKALSAIFFALVITMVVVVAMVFVGYNAISNRSSLPVLNAPPKTTNTTNTNISAATGSSSDQQTIAQMQQLINQYQAREKQYQTELNDAAQKLSAANQQLSQYSQVMNQVQRLLDELQRRGIIQITNDGQILIPDNGVN
jgi:hypothetical protein